MPVKLFAVGRFLANCYVASCGETREAIIVDPGFEDQIEGKEILDFVTANGLKLKYVVNTHGHPDHTCGNAEVKRKFNLPILIHQNDAHMLGKSSLPFAEFFGYSNTSPPADVLPRDGDSVQFGKNSLRVVHTPGHSRGSISLQGEREVFTGDTLFSGSIGRTDFPESSQPDLTASLKKLMLLPEECVVLSGHGPPTTIRKEKRHNPFLMSL